jgi:predicted membrane-bound mannosyltransferase
VGDRAAATRLLGRYGGHALGIALVFLGLVVFLFAPRGAGIEGIRFPPVPPSEGSLGLWQAVAQPAAFPGFVVDTLVGVGQEYASWFGASTQPGCNQSNVVDGYICFLGRYLRVMLFNAPVLGVLAVVGFLAERYGRRNSRNLVMAAGYIGLVSVAGYPLGTDIFGAWIVVHAVVVLAIPAAVGVGLLYRWGREAAATGDDSGRFLAVALLVFLALSAGLVTTNATYVNHSGDGNVLVQYAQPADDMRPATGAIREIAPAHDGPVDVAFYNSSLAPNSLGLVRPPGGVERDPVVGNPTPFNTFRPVCTQWGNTLPLNWYVVASGANATCYHDADDLATGPDPPPVIVTLPGDVRVPEDRLSESYSRAEYLLRVRDSPATVWVHEDWE